MTCQEVMKTRLRLGADLKGRTPIGLVLVLLSAMVVLVSPMSQADANSNITGVDRGKVTNGAFNALVSASSSAANLPENTCGLTRNQIVALWLTISWAETNGGDTSRSISPMSHSRGDFFGMAWGNDALYSDGTVSGNPQIFLTPGIGLFQLDTLDAIPDWMDNGRRTNAYLAADAIASTIVGQACAYNLYSDNRVYRNWFGCTDYGLRCNNIYASIYDVGSDRLNVVPEGSGDWAGGSWWTACRFGNLGPVDSPEFGCYFVDPQWQATGYTKHYQPWDGSLRAFGDNSNNSPVPSGYLSFSRHNVRYAIWLRLNNPYSGEFGKYIEYGNSRNGRREFGSDDPGRRWWRGTNLEVRVPIYPWWEENYRWTPDGV